MAAINFKWMALIIILASILPAFYFFKMHNPPAGYVFVGRHIDDGTNMAVMKSYIWNYNDPFISSNNTSVFKNPIPGPPYILVTLGILSAVLGIDPLVFIFLLTFIFTIAYFVLIYFIVGLFSKTRTEHNIGFLLFSVATGIGGILYIILNSLSAFPPERLIHLVIGSPLFTSRIVYNIIPMAMGYMFFLLLIKGNGYKNLVLMTIFLGLTILFYPFFGIPFLMIGGVFCIVRKKPLTRLLPSMVFFIPWAVLYLQNSLYSQYTKVATAEYYNFFVFFINGGFALLFAGIFVLHFLRSDKKDRDNLFLIIWAMMFVVLLFVQIPIVPKTRFVHFVWVPMSILAAKGIVHFSRNKTPKFKKILVIGIVVLSLPSIMMGFIISYGQEGFYVTQEEFDAMKALKQYLQGNVISSSEIGSFIPYYSEKMSLRGERQERQEIASDYTEFFSSSQISEKEAILKKYNITYIYFGRYERGVSNVSFDPEKLGVQKIYNNTEVSIYRSQP